MRLLRAPVHMFILAAVAVGQTYTISTLAGTGTAGYSGDGGPATSARLFNPGGVAVDASDRIYVAETTNSCIRLLTPASTSPCSYAVSTSDLSVAASGGQVKLTLHTSLGCAWSLSGLPSWLTVSGSSSGAASADITLVAGSNTGAARVAYVSVGGVSVPIRQTDSTACAGSA